MRARPSLPMRDEEHRSLLGGAEDIVHEGLGGRRVEVGGRLVQDQHGRVREQCTGQNDALTLTARELRALLAHAGVDPVRKAGDPLRQADALEHIVKLILGRSGACETQVLADRRVEDVRFLAGEGERAPDVLLPVLAQVPSRQGHATFLRIEEAEEEVDDGRLPRPARPHERHPPSWIEPQVDAVERGLLLVCVAGRHGLESEVAGSGGGAGRGGSAICGARSVSSRIRRPEASRDGKLTRRPGQRRDGFEGREGQKGEGRHEHAVELTGVVRRNGHREDARRRQSGDEEESASASPVRERIAPAQASELGVRFTHASHRVAVAPVHHELGRSAQESPRAMR